MGTSEYCSVGIANRPEELALPKVAVLFENIFTTERYSNVRSSSGLFLCLTQETYRAIRR
jgi:hypothetical protein